MMDKVRSMEREDVLGLEGLELGDLELGLEVAEVHDAVALAETGASSTSSSCGSSSCCASCSCCCWSC